MSETVGALIDYVSVIICGLCTQFIIPKPIVQMIRSYFLFQDKYLLLMAISPELKDNSKISIFNLTSNDLIPMQIQNFSPYITKGGRDVITNIQLPESIQIDIESINYLNPFKWNILLRIGGYKDGELTDESSGIVFNSDEPGIGYHIDLPPYLYEDNPQIIYNKYQQKIYGFSASQDITKVVILNTDSMEYDEMETELYISHPLGSLCWQNEQRKLFVLSGRYGKECEILDIENDKCIQIAEMNKRRCEAGSIAMEYKNDMIVIGGGYGDWDQNTLKTERTIEIYNGYKNIWNLYPKETKKDHRGPKLFYFDNNPNVLCICGQGNHFVTNKFIPNEYIEMIDMRQANGEWEYMTMSSKTKWFFNLKPYQYSMDQICVTDF
eukprot:69242_1